jgi:hypothetical protein
VKRRRKRERGESLKVIRKRRGREGREEERYFLSEHPPSLSVSTLCLYLSASLQDKAAQSMSSKASGDRDDSIGQL